MREVGVKIFDILIDALPMETVVKRAQNLIEKKAPSQIVTVNAEFLVAANHDDFFKAILQHSALNTADGFGVLWAAKYLSLPLVWKRWRRLEALLQIFSSVFLSLLSKTYARSIIPEKVSGVELVWRLCELAAANGYSVFFLGGFNQTPKTVANIMKSKFPKLQVAGFYAGFPDEPGLVEKLKIAKPDILFVAYGPIRQEKWIKINLKKLEIPLCLGVGGTFDYIAGEKPLAPKILREIGLEWAFRLITQPYRLRRIFTAVPVFMTFIFRSKILQQQPYRLSVALCLKNDKGEILICRRKNKSSEGNLAHWQLPHGGMEIGESVEQALRREMQEELNLSDFTIIRWAYNIFKYDWPIPLAKLYANQYRGQSLSIAYAFAAADSLNSIRPDQIELDAYRWVKPEVLLESVHPIQKSFTTAVLNQAPDFFTT